MRIGAEIHDEVDHFLQQITLDVVHNEVLSGVVALHVAPLALHARRQRAVDRLEDTAVVFNLLAVVNFLQTKTRFN